MPDGYCVWRALYFCSRWEGFWGVLNWLLFIGKVSEVPDTGLWLVFIRKVSGVSQKRFYLHSWLCRWLLCLACPLFLLLMGRFLGCFKLVAVHWEGFWGAWYRSLVGVHQEGFRGVSKKILLTLLVMPMVIVVGYLIHKFTYALVILKVIVSGVPDIGLYAWVNVVVVVFRFTWWITFTCAPSDHGA